MIAYHVQGVHFVLFIHFIHLHQSHPKSDRFDSIFAINMEAPDFFELPVYVRIAIEAKFGKPIRYPKDCIALAEDMYQVCKVKVSESTIKRLMGFVKGTERPRKYTLDILANYLGFTDYQTMHSGMQYRHNSEFQCLQSIHTGELKGGTFLEFQYEPDRRVIVKYAGNQTFEVKESHNSKLQPGDIFQVMHLVEGYPLILQDVLRNASSLGNFTAGKSGGIRQLRILHHEPERES